MKSLIKRKAMALGFDACGVTDDFEPARKAYFLEWLERRAYAGMEWLGRNSDKRLRPDSLLPGALSAVVVAVSYKHEPEPREYVLARYAYGADYHDWMRAKLRALADFIAVEASPGARCVSFVDTGPVLERDLAAKAGIGWIGKNTCLIDRQLGSFMFLGVLFCDRVLDPDVPAPDQCAQCRLCLDACPTGALEAYRLDPAKCLAYHNIEKRGERVPEYREALGNNLVGCDVCQEVCPWNYHAPDTRQAEWRGGFAGHELGDLLTILQTDASAYKAKVKGTAIARVKYEDFMRNVFLVIANVRRADLKGDVAQWRERNPGLAAAEAAHCLEKL